MNQRTNFMALILLDALEDENENDVYNILERNNVDASYVPRERGIAPLHYACGMENERLALDVTRRFLEIGANPNVRSEENMTPLHVAAMYGRVEIARLLLQHGAALDVIDDERKSPVQYAIEECHFDVVLLMRDHLFVDKYDRKQEMESMQPLPYTSQSHSKFDKSLPPQQVAVLNSTPNCDNNVRQKSNREEKSSFVNKNLLAVSNSLEEDDPSRSKYTPNRKHYNFDVTSPYYINITHRRNKPQPKFPDLNANASPTKLDDVERIEDSSANNYDSHCITIESGTTSTDPEIDSVVNIFTLTKENLQELSQKTPAVESSRISLIETWREKVQRSRARLSILKQFEDVRELIDNVVENEHLNFTNTVLKENSKNKPSADAVEADSGACGSTGSSSLSLEATQYAMLPLEVTPLPKQDVTRFQNMSLGKVIQKVAQAHVSDFEPEPRKLTEAESSYQTVPEMEAESNRIQLQVPQLNASDAFIRSPTSNEYFLQMTEAYVHTDDENGLVFYETKLLSNPGNKVAKQRSPANGRKRTPADLDTTATSQSTNLTMPVDYETDALRAELTTFGEPPGPITKSTKRLYIKRLIKYKRKTEIMQQHRQKQVGNEKSEKKFSVELQRTVRAQDAFERIAEYMKFETQSALYFANHENKKQMREGHLKQSFIYMLIDPGISCNLPGESVFLDKFDIWKRFLQSIFYVGKGKTSRPYSHLYDAMKTHSRMHNIQLNNQLNSHGKKVSIKKQPLNVDLFKSPPTKSSDSQKLDRILNIWGNGNGVVCLHVFHNIVPTEAYTREAGMIDALGLQHLTNVKRGDYYGPAKTWTMKEKKYLGIALLYKAMQIYLAEGESQLSPSDLI